MGASRIGCVIVESDQETVRQLDILCRKLGMIEARWKTSSLATGLEILRKHHPEMAIVGLGSSPVEAIASISSVARDFPSLYLLALSDRSDADLILQAMRAGAHDFLCKPVKEIDLRAATEKVFKLRAARQDPARGEGKIVSVFGNKGGIGTTTIAVNLADALVHYQGKKTVVVDLVLAHGDVSMSFNVNSSYSLADLAKNTEKADYDFLHSLLVKHSSGVYILADPSVIEEADQISSGQVRDVLSALRSMFDVIVVDTPHQFDERTLTALEMSDVVLLVSLLNIPSLKNTQKCLDLFGRLGIRDERVRLVLSRHLQDGEISKEKIEAILHCPVFFSVPNDYPAVISSVNRGKTLREASPDREVAKSFQRMASLLLGRQDKAALSPERRGLFGKLFRNERSIR